LQVWRCCDLGRLCGSSHTKSGKPLARLPRSCLSHTHSYTTDFDEMEQLFSLEKNPDLQMEELEAMLSEFRQDYNQKHFVRNESFKKAADNVQGEH